jgi:hypothetical protein
MTLIIIVLVLLAVCMFVQALRLSALREDVDQLRAEAPKPMLRSEPHHRRYHP